MKKISIVVPCYNEEAALPFFYEEITKVLSGLPLYDAELIFVDDGSKDKTLKILKELAELDKRVRYISFSRNFGKEAAMYAGFTYSTGDYTAVIDADLQDPPSLLSEMISILESGEYDSVATRRRDRKGESKIKSAFSRLFYKIINRVSDADVMDGARDFRLMNRKMLNAILSISEYNRFSKEIFGWVGFKTKWIDFENVERVAGTTKWSFGKLFKYAVDGIVNFSQVPLALSSWVGLLFTFIGIIAIIFVVIRKLAFGDPVSGWASLVCIILFIGGIQLFCTGIMGQYVAKTYMEVKDRPIYIVRESNALPHRAHHSEERVYSYIGQDPLNHTVSDEKDRYLNVNFSDN